MRQTINHSLVKKLPADHFGSVTNEVVELLLNGKCCAVYGLPGYGMEFFAKHIADQIENMNPDVLVILVNTELELNKTNNLKRRFADITNENTFDEVKITKYLEKNKIVLIIGEVLHVGHKDFCKFISNLNWLSKDNFTILTVANYSLIKYPEKYHKVGKNIFYPIKKISNFDKAGTKRIMELNNIEYNWNIPLNLTEVIYKLSGGNPALIKYICMALYEESFDLINRVDLLIKVQPLNKRLKDLAGLIPTLSIEKQKKIGLITQDGTLFAEILSIYVKENKNENLYTLFPNLTKNEYKLLDLFISNPNKIINKDQLSLILSQTLDSYSEWAIYKAINRLRSKIKPQLDIKTLRGKGWVLSK